MLYQKLGHGCRAASGINAHGFNLKAIHCTAVGSEHPDDKFILGYKIFFQHPCTPVDFIVIVLHSLAVKARGGQLLHVFIIKMFVRCTDAPELNS